MPVGFDSDDILCVNTIRVLAIDATEKAKSGHPGLPLGCAPMAYALWQRHLKQHAGEPKWPDRDRFVLSAGHGSMLLYSLLHLYGHLRLSDLKAFRQMGSLTPGHPESFITRGVEATTGPLGQGTANAVGMAMAERHLAHRFNREGFELFDHYTYTLVSDGDLMEGISAEAASLAGHLKLGKLIYLYDDNRISLDGPTDLCFTEDVAQRYESYGWQVLCIEDGDNDLDGIDAALNQAKAETQKPTLIMVRTTIGFGSPNKAGTSGAHGSPLGGGEAELTKQGLGFDPSAHFAVPDAALQRVGEARKRNEGRFAEWAAMLETYRQKHPDLATQT